MMYGRLTVNPVSAAWNTVARFDDYGSAQRAVGRLSDDGFPVEQLDIVGSDLQLVERVTGRLTKWRAAAAGALSGMWAGLLGIDMHTGQGDWPAGLLSHAAGTADDGTFVVAEVWSSRADQDAFMASRLGTALAAG